MLLVIITSSRRLLFTATGIGLVSITWLCLGNSGVTLEPPSLQLAQIPSDGKVTPQSNLIFVNPTVAQNSGDGSETAPFKTITQALQAVQPNGVIILSQGTYSTNTGEKFPLQLKPGVSIQGDPQTRGSNVVIKGGGTFLSPTFARQNITILGANQAKLTGVTITNSNSRGYGLWIESSSPVVSDNTFTENSHDGISITGNSAPTIRNNYFHQNGANGMTIYGSSRPEVRENLVEKTGFGINIAQKAAPLLVGNRIRQNRAGIVSQADARPVLRHNLIEDNKEDGVVAIANSQPDLGTQAEPGGNEFRQNGRYDINSSAAKQAVPAFGNKLAAARTSGNIDLAGKVNIIATSSKQSLAPLALNPRPDSLNNQAKRVVAENSRPAMSLSVSQNRTSREEVPATTTMAAIEIPVPPPAAIEQTQSTASSLPEKAGLTQISPLPERHQDDASESEGIEIPVPSASSEPVTASTSQNGSFTQGLPVLKPATSVASQQLPVPSPNAPIGDSRNQLKPTQQKKTLASSTGNPPAPPTRATALGLRYRVVVEASTVSRQAKVRSVVPGAFRTFSQGRVFMQLGAFSDRAQADQLQQTVSGKGLKATIEEFN